MALSISSTRRPTRSDGADARKSTSPSASAGNAAAELLQPRGVEPGLGQAGGDRPGVLDMPCVSSQSPSACSRSLCSSGSAWAAPALPATRCSQARAAALRCSAVSGCWSSRRFASRRRATASRRLSAARRGRRRRIVQLVRQAGRELAQRRSAFRAAPSARVFSRMRSAITPTSRGPSSGKRCQHLREELRGQSCAPRAGAHRADGGRKDRQARVRQHARDLPALQDE